MKRIILLLCVLWMDVRSVDRLFLYSQVELDIVLVNLKQKEVYEKWILIFVFLMKCF